MEATGRILFCVLSKYFWVLDMFITSIPVFTDREVTKDYVRENPDLALGYRKLFCGYLLLNSRFTSIEIQATNYEP